MGATTHPEPTDTRAHSPAESFPVKFVAGKGTLRPKHPFGTRHVFTEEFQPPLKRR